ncbi:hypothetical protein N7465_002235 [Penicillium sp. CMV-2018d]|nr:hypothetical protein N7465_002235 [Penicillium sp. CMV-2018d]
MELLDPHFTRPSEIEVNLRGLCATIKSLLEDVKEGWMRSHQCRGIGFCGEPFLDQNNQLDWKNDGLASTMLSMGANILLSVDNPVSLSIAAIHGQLNMVESLIKHDPTIINETSDDTCTPIMVEIVKFLLAQPGLDPQKQSSYFSYDRIRQLELGKKLGEYDTHKTPIDQALYDGNRELVQILLADIRVELSASSLTAAARGGNEDLIRLCLLRCPQTFDSAQEYVEDIGKLGWLADKSRPNIAPAVNKSQRRAAAPRPKDVEALKQLNRYVESIIHLGVLLGKDRAGLIGYVDASYNDCEDRKSTEAFALYYAGCPISWLSRKESLAVKSSTSAKYVAFDVVVQETMWLLKMLKQLDMPQALPATLFTDSDNAHAIMTTDNYAKGTKWLEARYHFVRHTVREGIIRLEVIASEDNVADALTKPLGRELFVEMRDRLMSTSEN